MPRGPSVTVAPFGLLRVAALPMASLFELTPPRTVAHIDAALRARAGMERHRAPLEQALHASVPLADPAIRRVLLALKRAIHNGRMPAIDIAILAAASETLPPSDRDAAMQWCDCAETVRRELAAADYAWREEVGTHVRPALRRIATDEAFLRPLTLASPSLYVALTQTSFPDGHQPQATKFERAVLRYAIRASAKSSPFSIFLHQALVGLDDTSGELPRLEPAERHSRVFPDRALLWSLQREVAEDDDVLTLNPSIRWGADGRIELLEPQYVRFSRRLLRLGKPVAFTVHSAVAARLRALPARFGHAALTDALVAAPLDSTRVATLVEQLCRRGVILTDRGVTGFHGAPEQEVERRLRASGDAGRNLRADALARLTAQASAIPDATSGERARLIAAAASEARCLRATGDDVTAESSAAGLWEDGYFRRPLGAAGKVVHDLVQELSRLLREEAVVTAPYVLLRDLFVEDYGRGGRCDDVMAFLDRASAALAGRQWWRYDPAAIEMPPSADARIALSALVQFEAESATAFDAGAGRIILNAAYPGCGTLSARHAFGDADFHRGLREGLTRWIARIAAPAEPVDLMLAGDCNPLQAHPRLTRRTLAWPIEPGGRAEDGAIALAQISICHNAVTGLLDLHDHDGRALRPFYLGATVPHPAWGAEFWLTTLASPFRIKRPIAELVPPDGDVELLALPRRCAGRVVLGRAAWWMTAARLRRLWYRQESAARLLDVAEDCARLDLPRYVFVRAERSAGSHSGDEHKPLWIDLRNPFCLDLLRPLLDRTTWISITEAMPSAPFWPALAGNAHTADLLVEMEV